MIRRSAACRCVRTSLSLQIEPDLLRRVITGDETWIFEYDPETKRQRPRKQGSQNQKSKSCWSRSSMSEAYRPQWILDTEPDDQSASLQRDPAAFASLSAREETRVAAGQFVAASPRQCTCSQRPQHPAVPGREEHRRTGATSLFTRSHSVILFSFPQAQGDLQGDPFWRRGGHQEGRNDGAEGHPEKSFQQCIEAWRRMEKCIRLEGITLTGKPSSLFRIKINCLWHQFRYFSDTPRILHTKYN